MIPQLSQLREGTILCAPRQVATAIDPASARLGESLYTFVPRSVVGNLRDGVLMELERLRVRNIPLLSLQNKRAPLPGRPMISQNPPLISQNPPPVAAEQARSLAWTPHDLPVQ